MTFGTHSADGEQGFPGSVDITIQHTLTADNEWKLHYTGRAETKTVLAMTNHVSPPNFRRIFLSRGSRRTAQVYFNLNANEDGATTVEKHTLTMPTASQVVAVDSTLIPTGKLNSVAQPEYSYLDFRQGKPIGQDINKGTVTPAGGYDNGWVFDGWQAKEMQENVATVYSPITGISVSMSTDQPSVQVYTGNFLNATDPTSRVARKKSQCHGGGPCYYAWRGAVTLEAQQYPDAVHHSTFPSIVLEPSSPYEQHTIYKFSSK